MIEQADYLYFTQVLEQTINNYKEREASFIKKDKVRNGSFFRRSIDPVLQVLKHQKDIYKTGSIHWGVLLQANSQLFTEQDKGLPANIIYSTDADINPHYMLDIAHKLYSLKNTTDSEDEIQKFVDAITNERERSFNRKLPRSITKNKSMYFTTIQFDPRHLPNKKIQASIFPIIKSNKYDAVIMLPYWYWSENFLNQYW